MFATQRTKTKAPSGSKDSSVQREGTGRFALTNGEASGRPSPESVRFWLVCKRRAGTTRAWVVAVSAGELVESERSHTENGSKYITHTLHGTAIGLPINWGGARGVNGAAYVPYMERLGYIIRS